jgi:hypothetical protein
MTRAMKCTLLLFASVLAVATAAPPPREVRIASDFPGGNIVVEKIAGDDVYVHQDLRDTKGDWFYWYFAVRGAQGRGLTFHFTKSKALGSLGPGVSRDGGRTWQWLGRSDSPTSFKYKFGPAETEVRFSFGMPYQHADLVRFLEQHKQSSHLKQEVLGKTKKGTPVELLRLGCLGATADFKVLVTVRHHACEMMASHVAEGVMEGFLGDTETSAWLRAHVECAVVPMVDKDGVEAGDQGKNRLPHDHKADYRGASIYPEVAALRAFVEKWSGGRPDVTLDLHNPSINHRIIYSHALRKGGTAEKKFLETLEKVQRGPLPFRVQDSVEFAAKMAGKDATAYEPPATPAAKEPDDARIAIGLEIPYALVGKTEVTANSARAFGHDLARALAANLKAAR